MDETDIKYAGAIKEQIQALTEIVGTLIDSKSGKPLPSTTKEQLLYAIQEISKVQSIYDRRVEARKELEEEVDIANEEFVEVQSLGRNINKRANGEAFPKWFAEMLGL